MTVARIKQTFLWAGIVLALTFLLVKTYDFNHAAHAQAVGLMRAAEHLNTLLNESVLKSRLGILNNYDPLVDQMERIEKINQELRSGYAAVYRQGQKEVDDKFDDVIEVLDEKQRVLESFKSKNAVLKSTLNYFPFAVSSFIEGILPAIKTLSKDEAEVLENLMNNLLADTLTYAVGDNQDRFKAHIEEDIANIETARGRLPAEHNEAARIILIHARNILKLKPEVDALVNKLIKMPVTQKYGALYDGYQRWRDRHTQEAGYYRLALYIVSILLLGYLAYVLVKLKKNTAELEEAVSDLERQKVALNESRKEVETANNNLRFQKLAMDCHAIVSITDETGNIIYVNDKFCEVSQYQREDLLGRNHRIVNSGLHSRDFFAEFWRTISSGKVWQGEIRNRKKDGTFYWVATTVVPFLNDAGKPYQYISIRTDITNQKIAEEALRKINDELEERVRARTADLDANNKQLDYYLRDLMRKNEENETFVYSVSHDLRSPLVNLQGFSQELIMVGQDIRKLFTEGGCPPEVQKRGLALLDEDMAGSIRFIQAGVMRLSNIIDALLRLSRAGRVEYQLQQIDLNPIIKRIIDSMSVIIAQRGATVTAMENLPAAWVDPAAAEQIFANLIGNALNYLDPKRPGKIEIGCRMEGEETADGRLNIYYVKDNGLGISEQAQTKLFRIFQRFHPGSAKGEGVGLAIVRRVIERHGGRISVESKEGEGTTFFVVLPAQQTKQAPVLSEDSLLAAAN